MTQQLSALPRVQSTTAAHPAAALTSANDAEPAFADTLESTLDEIAAADDAESSSTTGTKSAAIDDALGLILPPGIGTDSGNRSPQSGSDLPLDLQWMDANSALPPVLLEAQTVVDAAVSQPMPPAATPDVKVALGDMAAPASEIIAALPTPARAPASAQASVAVSTPASVLVADALNAREALALPTHAAAQTATQDQQQRTQKDLELLTSFVSVLVPVKERGAEPPLPAMLSPATAEMVTANSSVPPFTASALVAPHLVTTSSAALGKVDLAIPQAPGQPGWGDVFADRVSFAVRQSLQEAEIRLNPPQLGQVDVRIVMHNDQASLMFSSPHGAVRDAIEASVARLRDMLAESGFSLVNVDVSDKSLAQQHDAREQQDSRRGGSQAAYRADFEFTQNAPAGLGATGAGSVDYYV